MFKRILSFFLCLFIVGAAPAPAPDGISKIKHVVIIMQENRSFDTYFGTYPGADGIPMKNGVPTVCLPDVSGPCVRPFHSHADRTAGGPHNNTATRADVDGGKMDGFLLESRSNRVLCSTPNDADCTTNAPLEVMSYHDQREIPNYWAYARAFVLQDHMFEPSIGWSVPAHLFEVSAWSAKCERLLDPMSCRSSSRPEVERDFNAVAAAQPPGRPDYAWTDITYLLHKNNVSWAYYVMKGDEQICPAEAVKCPNRMQFARTPGIWNPLPYFDTVKQDGQLGNIKDMSQLFADLRNNTLPAVSWLAPSGQYSEHPPSSVANGQAYVTGVINAIMRSPEWDSTAIFVVWDDWGGYYDHVVPPQVDELGYGIRVPGLVISPYAKRGYIDRQTLSFDAYLKFIEDDFLGGARIDPATDGRPDSRPSVRENVPILGDLRKDFDFTQAPRLPMLLPGGIEPPYPLGP